jgi:DNA-nicking Smr family endonuclease
MRHRPLSAEERQLWHEVARSVRALSGRVLEPVSEAPPQRSVEAPITRQPAPASRPAIAPVASASANTLDGNWDRRFATGRVAPDRTIDLHGCSAAQAHARLDMAIDRAVADGARVLLIVTGRAPSTGASRIDLPLRGIIRASIGDWLAVSRHAARIAAVRAAHPRHGGAGALYLVLRAKRRTD